MYRIQRTCKKCLSKASIKEDGIVTPWNGVLLEKLIVVQVVIKFPDFCGTSRFIVVFTRARY
jgi:hypothetical protein